MASTDVLSAKEWKVQMKAHRVAFTKWFLLSGSDSFITSPFPPPLPFEQEPCLLSQGVTLTGKSTSRQNFQSICWSNSAKGISLLSLTGLMLKAASFQDWFRDVRRQLNCLFCFTFPSGKETEMLVRRSSFLSWCSRKHQMGQEERSLCFSSLICCKYMLVCKWPRCVSQFDGTFYWTSASADTRFTPISIWACKLWTRKKSCQIIKPTPRFEHLWSAPAQHGANARHRGCCSIKIKLGKINCPEARSVNFHTLSPISLKVEVLNQIKPGQCTMELCTKWHSYVKWQPLRNTVKAGKL